MILEEQLMKFHMSDLQLNQVNTYIPIFVSLIRKFLSLRKPGNAVLVGRLHKASNELS